MMHAPMHLTAQRLNMCPAKHGVSKARGLSVIVQEPELDHTEHSKKKFGEFVQSHLDHKMTNDDDSHFLETEIIPTIGNIQFKHWNKNVGDIQEYYKGKHFYSIGPMVHKIGAIIGTFIRIDRNSSNMGLFEKAMQEKARELLSLKYPKTLLLNILYKMSIKGWCQGEGFKADRWLLPNISIST